MDKIECSCYYKSNERKKWDESRTECLNRESDLVVIDSEKEQEFVRDLNEAGASWIGLKAEFIHRSTGWEPKWEWVDGSPLTVKCLCPCRCEDMHAIFPRSKVMNLTHYEREDFLETVTNKMHLSESRYPET